MSLTAARAGDHDAFSRLTSPYVRQLEAHCTRIVGNAEDGRDALQDTLLRAWLRLDRLRDEGSLRSWLYAIATNTSVNLLRARRRRAIASDSYGVLESARDGSHDVYERRESVERAFAAAIRALPPRQRVVLILRDALALSASEVAELLRTTTASVNSALQRARAGVALAGASAPQEPPLDDLQRALLGSYVAAWEATDILRLLAVARADAVRMALIEGLSPRGGGWVHVPDDDWGAATFRPAFAERCRAGG